MTKTLVNKRRLGQLVPQQQRDKGAVFLAPGGELRAGEIAHDEEFARKVDVTITKLSLLADRLEQGHGSAGRLLNDPSLYTNADQMLLETRGLIKAIRENPKRYLTIHFRVF